MAPLYPLLHTKTIGILKRCGKKDWTNLFYIDWQSVFVYGKWTCVVFVDNFQISKEGKLMRVIQLADKKKAYVWRWM